MFVVVVRGNVVVNNLYSGLCIETGNGSRLLLSCLQNMHVLSSTRTACDIYQVLYIKGGNLDATLLQQIMWGQI